MREFFKDYGTLWLALLTGFGYLVGLAAVSQFAQTLGVSVQDLGLDTRDYILLAAIYGSAVGLVVLVCAAIAIGVRTSGERAEETDLLDEFSHYIPFFLVIPLAVFLCGIDTLFYGEPLPFFAVRRGLVAILVPTFVLGLALHLWRRSVKRAHRRSVAQEDWWWSIGTSPVVPPGNVPRAAFATVLVSSLVLVFAFGVESARVWAERLEDGENSREPVVLSLLIQPATGELPTGSCVIRVSPKVWIEDGNARVREIADFVTTACDP